MPVKIVTPSRAGLIVTTAVVVSLVQLALIAPSTPSPTSLDACGLYYLDTTLMGPISQDDPRLLEWVMERLVPPSRQPYNLDYAFSGLPEEYNSSNPYSPSQEFILENVENFFGSKIGDSYLFLEAGAYDGEFLSNTLLLEKTYGWRGVLVEPGRDSFLKLLSKHRKAWAINACLSTNPYPSQESFSNMEATGKVDFIANPSPGAAPNVNTMTNTGKASSRLSQYINASDEALRVSGHEVVQCLPLYSIVRALNINHIHFFSLDVEGAEMSILHTIPWKALKFTMLAIEHTKNATNLNSFMSSKGYTLVAQQYPDYIYTSSSIDANLCTDEEACGLDCRISNENISGDLRETFPERGRGRD
ncbi:Methyltransferase FkbM [Trinorchestia longiramus]|nr:Methyltransferase FkbM [Trinorchestia longiramus]